MVQGKWFPTGSDITQPLLIRQRVFGRGRDELDSLSQQVAVYQEGQAVGSARLWWKDGAFWLGEVGVLPEERGKGFGDLLIRLLLFKALTHQAGLICAEAPEETRPFFEKYGFTAADGQNPATLSIRGEAVQLSHCGGSCENCDHRTPECTPKALR